MGQNAGLIRKFFEDLNLNEAEQARLREGFELMRRQFEAMSDDERWAQFAQMAEMGQRWQNMSDQEREGGGLPAVVAIPRRRLGTGQVRAAEGGRCRRGRVPDRRGEAAEAMDVVRWHGLGARLVGGCCRTDVIR